jgi:SEC-C motif-containing protein
MQCPCGSNISFKQCCFLFINQQAQARSPEQLMRSRYSAYAKKSADYIYNTYAESSRSHQSLTDILAWAKDTKWLKLTINSASEYADINIKKSINSDKKEDKSNTVCFSAYYQHQGTYFIMKETSRFIVEDSQWRYLDGEVSINEELPTPKRNELCFCYSNKKFKQCCGS